MKEKTFIKYIGDYRVHDGVVQDISQKDGTAIVVIRSIEQEDVIIEFHRVKEIRDIQSKGMMLYSLSEMSGEEPYRHFIFTNWDERSNASLEVIAMDITYNGGTQ